MDAIMDEVIEHHRYEVIGSDSGSQVFVARVKARNMDEAIVVACQRLYGKSAWFHRDMNFLKTDHLRTDSFCMMYGQILKSLRTKRNGYSGSTALTDRMRIEVSTLERSVESSAMSKAGRTERRTATLTSL